MKQMPSSPLLVVDSNERATAPKVVRQLEVVFGEEHLAFARLPEGDVSVPLGTGLLLIERKTPQDFLHSLADGRLFNQVHRMTKVAQWAALIITGRLTYTDEDRVRASGRLTQWRGGSVRAAIQTVQWSGCAVTFCPASGFAPSVQETIKVALKDERVLKHQHPVEYTMLSPEARLLASIHGVGTKRARALMEFAEGSLANALEWATCFPVAKVKDKNRAHGWGDKTCTTVRDLLGLSKKQYIRIMEWID